jgi:hypothetical protein
MLSVNSDRLPSILKMRGEEECILGMIFRKRRSEKILYARLLEYRKKVESTMDWISNAWETVNRSVDLGPMGKEGISMSMYTDVWDESYVTEALCQSGIRTKTTKVH